MPGWHEAAKDWRDEHDLVILGITQEQHPERCELFAQWKNLDWPILHDPINLLGSTAVPLVVAIDEHGIVRDTRPRPNTLVENFLTAEFADDQRPLIRLNAGPDHLESIPAEDASRPAMQQMADADALILWSQDEDRWTQAITRYRQVLEAEPKLGEAHFRLGVALRMRSESPQAQDADFQTAVSSWQQALEINPNQYIWRRRIQQYGPRLDKPYPFYDWVSTAQAEIKERGESPVELAVEPRGAEIAQPARSVPSELIADNIASDPDGRIHRDSDGLIRSRPIVVQGTGRAGRSYRVHLEFEPNESTHWNNEAEPMAVWFAPGDGISINRIAVQVEPPEQAESTEVRRVEVEVQIADGDSPAALSGYALYNVCESAGGQCLFLRQDFKIELK